MFSFNNMITTSVVMAIAEALDKYIFLNGSDFLKGKKLSKVDK